MIDRGNLGSPKRTSISLRQSRACLGKRSDFMARKLGLKRSFCAIYIYKRTLYQDRLGTNIGKTPKKDIFRTMLPPIHAENACSGGATSLTDARMLLLLQKCGPVEPRCICLEPVLGNDRFPSANGTQKLSISAPVMIKIHLSFFRHVVEIEGPGLALTLPMPVAPGRHHRPQRAAEPTICLSAQSGAHRINQWPANSC